MPLYGFICEECSTPEKPVSEVIYLTTWRDYSEEIFPSCSHCQRRMIRTYKGAGITYRSKGVFPCDIADMESWRHGDTGPVHCEDYQDYKRKLKERGLCEKEPTKNTAHALGIRWT